jgi:MFS transporter, DHA2 family, multidrug resistance protein
VPAAKSGAASAVSETAYELGAVIGTATLGTIFTAFYRANVELPQGLSAQQAADAGESIGGATAVAQTLPGDVAGPLLDSAHTAFDSGIAPTSIIAGVLTLVAAAVVAFAFRNGVDRPASAPTLPTEPRSERDSTSSMARGRRASRATRWPRTTRSDRARRADCSTGC